MLAVRLAREAHDPLLLYFERRSAEDRFTEVCARHPSDAWLAMAAGSVELASGDFAAATERRPLSTDGVADLRDLYGVSDEIAYLASNQSDEETDDPTRQDLRGLARGKASAAAHRVAALAVPPSADLTLGALSVSYALSVREDGDDAARIQMLRARAGASFTDMVIDFVRLSVTMKDPESVYRSISRLDLRTPGYLLRTAVSALGEQAPERGRQDAKRLLFIGERPWFR